ncbi:MAG: DUF423 domain-containing protein [Proteobacteria bacterium]|nr:DUF423 domain-containing protein [Pseudomonadota bacterium]
MGQRAFAIGGCFYGLTGVGLGAFGAHGLAGLDPARLASWDNAVTYQLLHAVALLVIARFADNVAWRVAGWSFLTGVLLFSGSIYLLILGGPRILGPITPVGGVAFLIGWAALLYSAVKHNR